MTNIFPIKMVNDDALSWAMNCEFSHPLATIASSYETFISAIAPLCFEDPKPLLDILYYSGFFGHAIDNIGEDKRLLSIEEGIKKIAAENAQEYKLIIGVINEHLQKVMFGRSENGVVIERKDMQEANWITRYKEELVEAIKALKICDAITPTITGANTIAILGSTKDGMELRINSVIKWLKEGRFTIASPVYILAGDRPAFINSSSDGGHAYLDAVALENNLVNRAQVTEYHIAKDLSSMLKKAGFADITVLNSTKAEGRDRPTTETTVQTFVEKYGIDNVVPVIFVSNGYHTRTQEAQIQYYIQNRFDIKWSYSVNGEGCEVTSNNLKVILSTLAGRYNIIAKAFVSDTKH
jgi:hypothetical protein